MVKRRLFSILILCPSVLALWPSIGLAKSDAVDAVHRDALVIDAHADVYNPLEWPGRTETIDAGSEVDVDYLRRGGIDAVFLSVHAPQEIAADGHLKARKTSEAKLMAIREIAARHNDKVAIATTPAEIRKVVASGRTAIIIGLLNGSPYSQTRNAVEYLYSQNVRIIGMVHQGNNELADSSRPFPRQKPDENGGLSPLGRQWVSDANRLGIVLDVSQLSTTGLMQTIALSKAPVLASHSGVRSVVENGRNLTDAELEAVAQSGGAVCIVAFTAYLVNSLPQNADMKRIAELSGAFANGYEGMTVERKKELYAELSRIVPRASIDQYIDSIDAAVKKIGVDHVCLSSDFNHGVTGIDGWRNEGETPNITAALLRRGYSPQDIDKLWGGNILRVMERVQQLRKP